MALADFFHRDAVAISQVLQGFETDAFAEHLQGVRVAIAFGEEAATSRDGRDLLDLSVRLAARLYPSLMFATVPAGEQCADELLTLARNINPNIEASPDGCSQRRSCRRGGRANRRCSHRVRRLRRLGGTYRDKGPLWDQRPGQSLWCWIRRLLGGGQSVSLALPPGRVRFAR